VFVPVDAALVKAWERWKWFVLLLLLHHVNNASTSDCMTSTTSSLSVMSSVAWSCCTAFLC
jgi:hypothetical protein